MIKDSYKSSGSGYLGHMLVSPLIFCRDDLYEDNYKCFMKDNLFAHTTTSDRLQSILEKGINVMDIDERIHQNFDGMLEQECLRMGVYDMACEARENSTFFYADFDGAIDQSIYMGGLENINFKEPVIIIAELDKKNISIDPENNRYEEDLRDFEGRIQRNIEDSLALQHSGNVSRDRLKYYCKLDSSITETMILNPEMFIEDISIAPDYIRDKYYTEFYEYLCDEYDDCEENISINKKEEYLNEFLRSSNENDDYERLESYEEAEEYALDSIYGESYKIDFSEYIKKIINSGEYWDFEENVKNMDNWNCFKIN